MHQKNGWKKRINLIVNLDWIERNKMKLTLYQIDAFTETLFSGNPAAICILDSWLDEHIMQQIAMENNLAETAFVVKAQEYYEIRWFTPEVEVDLCGHATLASAYVLFQYFDIPSDLLKFYSHRSGNLSVQKGKDGLLTLNFPTDELSVSEPIEELNKAIGKTPIKTLKGKSDFLLIYEAQNDIEHIKPDMELLSKVGGRGVIVSAPGNEVDFVSRFFAPQAGINEDPVTGSTHTTLTPYWSKELNKNVLSAKQLSTRGGDVFCEDLGERIKISGKAAPYLIGEIEI